MCYNPLSINIFIIEFGVGLKVTLESQESYEGLDGGEELPPPTNGRLCVRCRLSTFF